MRVPTIIASALLIACASVSLASSAAASREAVVYLTKAGFSPRSATIDVGDRVRFTVRDHKAHQLAKTSGPNAGAIAPDVLESQGNSVTLTPDEVGTYTYVDRLNPRTPDFRLTVRASRH
jgi:plastocyanin